MLNYAVPTNIIPINDKRRLKKLYQYEILDTPPEHAFDTIASLAAQIFDAPSAFVTFVDEDRVFFKANISGLEASEVARAHSFCSLAILGDATTVFADTHVYEEFMDNPYVTAKGGIRFYAGSPIKTAEGFKLGTVCVVDSVPREPNEKQLEMLQKLSLIVIEKLETRRATRKTLKAYDDRLQMMVHDLKNPMTTISLQSELLGRIPDINEKAKLIAGKIYQQSKNIIGNINNVLSLARNEHGVIKLIKTKVLLKDIFENLADNFDISLKNKNQTLSLPANDLTEIFADEEKLQDIMDNLVGNAIKYSNENTNIKVICAVNDGRVTITISDEGLGLSEDDLGKLFVKFAKLSAQPTGGERSSGLGLSIVKLLVNLHRGNVWAVSKGKNKGTTFFVELPVK
ncbi:signal transduction histidine kinase [Pedobacter sp. UYP30]|uniref:GAF domain-containing sensor histidine kinase n=1 Tax=Pedobacter sp. UYP30 TaxID=1756400 RepID=UPI00339A7374